MNTGLMKKKKKNENTKIIIQESGACVSAGDSKYIKRYRLQPREIDSRSSMHDLVLKRIMD